MIRIIQVGLALFVGLSLDRPSIAQDDTAAFVEYPESVGSFLERLHAKDESSSAVGALAFRADYAA